MHGGSCRQEEIPLDPESCNASVALTRRLHLLVPTWRKSSFQKCNVARRTQPPGLGVSRQHCLVRYFVSPPDSVYNSQACQRRQVGLSPRCWSFEQWPRSAQQTAAPERFVHRSEVCVKLQIRQQGGPAVCRLLLSAMPCHLQWAHISLRTICTHFR